MFRTPAATWRPSDAQVPDDASGIRLDVSSTKWMQEARDESWLLGAYECVGPLEWRMPT